jgi:hypothetical protein
MVSLTPPLLRCTYIACLVLYPYINISELQAGNRAELQLYAFVRVAKSMWLEVRLLYLILVAPVLCLHVRLRFC